MLLVGLENCKGCHIAREKYPDVAFVEVPRQAGNANKDVFEVKKALGRLGIKEFPVLLNDDLTQVLPMSLLDKGIDE